MSIINYDYEFSRAVPHFMELPEKILKEECCAVIRVQRGVRVRLNIREAGSLRL